MSRKRRVGGLEREDLKVETRTPECLHLATHECLGKRGVAPQDVRDALAVRRVLRPSARAGANRTTIAPETR